VREKSNLIIDTSDHTVHTLRRLLLEEFGQFDVTSPLQVQIISFGHKHGVLNRVDLLFDVRHLPNPYFEKGLRELPGTDEKVIDFLERQEEFQETSRRFIDLLEYLLPLYRREGKSYLTIGVGCTGGRHRSVRVANKLAEALQNGEFEVSVMHRDVQK